MNGKVGRHEGHLVRHARADGGGLATWRALVAQLTVLLQYAATQKSEPGRLVAAAAFGRPDQARCPPKWLVNDCLRGHYVVTVYLG